MPTCVSCTHFTLRDHPNGGDDKSIRAAQDLAKKNGFGRCAKGPAWRFLSPSIERECKKHQPADQATTEQRKAWLAER